MLYDNMIIYTYIFVGCTAASSTCNRMTVYIYIWYFSTEGLILPWHIGNVEASRCWPISGQSLFQAMFRIRWNRAIQGNTIFTDGYCSYTSHTNTKASHHFSLYSAMPYEDGSVTMCTSWYLRFSTIQFTYSAFKHFHMTHIGYIGIFCLPDTLPKSIFPRRCSTSPNWPQWKATWIPGVNGLLITYNL